MCVFASQRRHSTSNSWHQGPTVEMPLYIHMNMCFDSWHAGSKTVHYTCHLKWFDLYGVRIKYEVAHSFVLVSGWVCLIWDTRYLFHSASSIYTKQLHIFRLRMPCQHRRAAMDQVVPCKESHHTERLSFSVCSQKLRFWEISRQEKVEDFQSSNDDDDDDDVGLKANWHKNELCVWTGTMKAVS